MKKIKFDDFIRLNRGFDLPDSQIIDGIYPVVASTSIKAYHNQYKVEPPVVVTGRSGSLGQVQYIDQKCWPLNTSLYAKDFKGNHPKYVFYYLQMMHLEKYNAGVGVPTLNQNHLHNLKIFVHGIDEQKKIASILSAYDSQIENNQKRIKLLEQMAENLYKEWFVRFRFPGYETAEFKGGVPKGWKIKRIGEICDTIGGGTPSTTNSDFWGGTIKWVTPTDITSNKSLPLIDVKEKITELGLKKSSAKMLPPHTILMTSRASIGFFGICEEEVCTNQGFISIIPGEDNLRMYMLHNLMMRKDEIVANANGSTFLEISKGRFRKMHMLIPTHELLCSFQKQAQKCFDTVLVLEKQIRLLTTQRDLLLPRLMSGKLSI